MNIKGQLESSLGGKEYAAAGNKGLRARSHMGQTH